MLPPERFSDEYAPADPKFAGEKRGADADEINGLLSTCCSGWKQPPTPREFYGARERGRVPRQRKPVLTAN